MEIGAEYLGNGRCKFGSEAESGSILRDVLEHFPVAPVAQLLGKEER